VPARSSRSVTSRPTLLALGLNYIALIDEIATFAGC
jgi:hypothetical protein